MPHGPINQVTGERIQHKNLTGEQFDALSPLEQLEIEEGEAPTQKGDESPNGFAKRDEAITAGLKAGIANPGAVPFNNRFFFTDPSISVPTGTFASEFEAKTHAINIGRADLIPVFDPQTGRFRLDEAPQTGIASMEFNAALGQFVVEFADGRTQLVKPPPTGTTTKPFGTTKIPFTDFVLVNDGRGGTSIVQKSEVEKPDFQLGDIQERRQFQFIETSPGNFQRLPEAQGQGEIITQGGRQFIRQPNGSLTPLAPVAGQGEVITQGGRQFIRQPDGGLQLLSPEQTPTIEQMISRFLQAGEVEAAVALADFRDRPTSMEAFQAALDFAQSPGDTAAISAIARGHNLVEPPPAGTVQRIADQPEFLQSEFQKLMSRFRGGGGTPNDIVEILSSASKRIKEDQDARLAAEQDLESERQQARGTQLKDLIKRVEAAEKAVASGTGTSTPPPPPPPSPIIPPVGGTDTVGGLGEIEEGFDPEDPFAGINPDAVAILQRDLFSTGEPPPPDTTVADAFNGGGSNAVIDQTGATVEEPTPKAFELFRGEDDFLAKGGVLDDNTAIVGEDGPELLIAAPGAKVIPLKGVKDKNDLAKLKAKFGIKGLAHGGTVESLLPIGVRQALAGRPIAPTRRRLSTAAGLTVLSGQAQQNLLPEELDVFDRLRAEAGIPLGAFQQEQLSALPGVLRRRPSRFAPRVLR